MSGAAKVLVTGGGSGLGAELVRRVTEAGGRAAALDLADKDGIETHDGARFIKCDITDAEAVEAATAQAVEHLGGLDSMFAAAGAAGARAPIHRMTPEEWRATMSINLDGVFYTLRAAAPHMTNGGSIVAVCSVAGMLTFGTPGSVAYMTAKAGLATLVKVAALELARLNIRVNAVAPGMVTTTRFLESAGAAHGVEELAHQRVAEIPLGGETTPADVVSLVLFLMSDAGRRITGTVLTIDAGQSLLGGGTLKPPE